MTQPAILPADTLLDVFERHYRPERLTLPVQETLQRWRQALRWFGDALDRPAVISDLTPETVESAAAWIAPNGTWSRSGAVCKKGISKKGIAKFRRHIVTLWRYIEDLKIVSNAPARKRTGRKPSKPRRIAKREPRPTLENWDRKNKCTPNKKKRLRFITLPREEIAKLKPTDRLDDLVAARNFKKRMWLGELTQQRYYAASDELSFLLDRPALIQDLTEENIENVLQQVLLNGRETPTANGYRSKLLALAKFAHKNGIIASEPEVEKLAEIERVPIGWTQEQLHILFKACQAQKGKICGVPTSDWLIALHAVLYDSAERIGAILQARWDRLDWTTGRLVIPAECRKHKRADKEHKLHGDTVEFLKRIVKPQRELIFPWHLHRWKLWTRYGKLLERAGLANAIDRKRKFHCMRKTSASFFKAAGGDPVDLLGHSDPNTTRVYLVPSIVMAIQPADVLPRPYGSQVLRLTEEKDGKAS